MEWSSYYVSGLFLDSFVIGSSALLKKRSAADDSFKTC